MLALGASLFALAYVQPLAPLSSRSVVARSSVTQMGGPGAPAGTSGRYLSFDQDGVFPGNPEPGQEAACQGAVASGVAGRAHLAERSRPAERRGERWALLEAGGCG